MTDFDEFDIIERHAKEAAARRLEEAKAANAAMLAQEKREAEERTIRTLALSQSSNEMIRLAEYDAHGVEPLPGAKVTIGLLFKLGFKIVGPMESRRLMAPEPEQPRRRTREDYYRDGGT